MNVRSGSLSATTALQSVEMLGMSMTVLGNVGVTVLTALTRTGRSRPIFLAYSVLATTTAAAPSEVAQMSRRCSGSLTTALASTSSTLTSLR